MSRGDRLAETLRRLLSPDDNIVGRTVTGGVWVTINNVIDRILQLATVLVLARLVGPTAFGLFGIALVIQSALKRLTRLGFDSALIQHRDDDVDTYLDTVWTVKTVRGLAIGILLFVAAPLASRVFGDPQLINILRVFAALPVISGLQNPGVVYFVKDLEFHRDVAHKLSSRLAYVLVGLGVGFVTRSVWALVFAMIASSVVSLVVSYLIHSYRPRPRFDRSAATELFGFGKWIFGSEWLSFLINEGDDVFVGLVLGPAALGIYQLSYQLSNAPATEITHPIQRVLFPAYSKIQDDVASLRRGYFTTIRVISLLSFPASVGIVVVAPVFVRAVLGPDWLEMIIPIQVLGAYAVVRSIRSSTVPLFRAIDRPDYDTKIRMLKLILIGSFIYPAAQMFGVAGVALVILGHALVVAPIASYVAVRSVDGRMVAFGRALFYPAVGSTVMGAVVYGLRERLVGVPLAAELPLLILTGVFVYVGVVIVLERQFGVGLDQLYQVVHDWAQ